MRSKKYGLEIYGQPNKDAWVSRDASGGNDGAHVSSAEIENGNQLKLTLSDGQSIVASGTISTGHFSNSVSQNNSIFFDNGNVGIGSDTDFAAKLHISGTILSTEAANFGGTNFTDGVIIDSESIKVIPNSQPAKIELYCESSGSHKVTLQAPSHANFSGDVVFTLPNSTGSANQVLVTDGSGATSWVDGSTITGSSQSSNFLINFAYDVRPDSGSNSSFLTLYDYENSSFYYDSTIDINTIGNNSGFNRNTSTSFETSPSDAQKYFISGFVPCDSSITKVQMNFSTFSSDWAWPSGITMLIFKGSYNSGTNANIQWNLVSRLSSGALQDNSIVFIEEELSSSNSFSKGDLWCAAFYSDDNPNALGAGPINLHGNLYFSDYSYSSNTGGGSTGGESTGGGSTGGGSTGGGSTGAVNPVGGTYSKIRIVSLSQNLSMVQNETSSITLGLTGVDASNYNKFIDFESPVKMTTSLGRSYFPDEIDVQFSLDYSLLTISWTNLVQPVASSSSYVALLYGNTAERDQMNTYVYMYFNTMADPIQILTDQGIGKHLADIDNGNRPGLLLSPPYMSNSQLLVGYDNSIQHQSHKPGNSWYYHNGPAWHVRLFDTRPHLEQGEYGNTRVGTKGAVPMAAKFTREGILYQVGMTDRLEWDLSEGTYSSPNANTLLGTITPEDASGIGTLSLKMWYYKNSGTPRTTNVDKPDENTDIFFYIKKEGVLFNSTPEELSTDIKIKINMGPFINGAPVAENMTISFYRNHNTSNTGMPYWVEYDDVYLSGQPLKSVAAGAPTILDVNGFGQDGKIQVMFEDVTTNNSTSIEYTIDGQNWTPFESTVSPQTISGLQNGTSYTIKLRSINALGTLGESNSLSATPTPTLLSAPTFTLTPIIDGFRVDPFNRPEHSSSRPISGYVVEITEPNGQIQTDSVGTSLESGQNFTKSSHIWPEVGETYSVRIKSRHNISGDESIYSSPLSVTAGIPPAMAPTITSLEYNASKELIISHNTNDIVTGDTKIYEYSLNGGAWTTYYHEIDGVSQQSAPTISVDTSVKNSISMRITNIIGTGPESSPAFLPIDILPTASEIGPDSIKWSFTPLGAEYGITKYYISTRVSSGLWQAWEELPADTFEYLLTGLDEGISYKARIKSENTYGESYINEHISAGTAASTGVSPSRLSAEIFSHLDGLRLSSTALSRDAWDASGGNVEFIIEFTNVDTAATNEVVIVPFNNQLNKITIPVGSELFSPTSHFFIHFGSRYKVRGKQRVSFDGGATTHESVYSNLSSEAVSGISPSFDFPFTTHASGGTFQEFGATDEGDGFSFNFGLNGGSVDTSTSNPTTTIAAETTLRYSVGGDGVKRRFGQVDHIDDHKFYGTIYGDPSFPNSDELDYQPGIDYDIQIHFDTGGFSGDSNIITHRHSLLPPKPSASMHHTQGTTTPWPRIKVFYNSQDHKDFTDLIPFVDSRFDGENIANVENLVLFQYETNESGVWRYFAGADHTGATGGDFGNLAITTDDYIRRLAQDEDVFLHIQTMWDSALQQWVDIRDTGFVEGHTFNIRIRTAGVKFFNGSLRSQHGDRFGEPSDLLQVTVGPQAP